MKKFEKVKDCSSMLFNITIIMVVVDNLKELGYLGTFLILTLGLFWFIKKYEVKE